MGAKWLMRKTYQPFPELANHFKATIEVYREPHFTGYSSKTVLPVGDQAKSLAFPGVVVNVAELLER
jgi:hypothetical protein